MKIGLCGRNDTNIKDFDLRVTRRARIQTMKMMSNTGVDSFFQLEQLGVDFIVRLFDDRLRNQQIVSPADFVQRMSPVMDELKPYARRFEIHNEPNHLTGLEGWGQTNEDAKHFNNWYLETISLLRNEHPWASYGFPGLALHHNDLAWLDICANSINVSDWLGCHTYWQFGNMFSGDWGLRFKHYHRKFPKKKIHITEFGDSTPDRPPEKIAELYPKYYQELQRFEYLGSASAFIASSPDPNWGIFTWVTEDGVLKPVVNAVGGMEPVVHKPKPKPKKKVPAKAIIASIRGQLDLLEKTIDED